MFSFFKKKTDTAEPKIAEAQVHVARPAGYTPPPEPVLEEVITESELVADTAMSLSESIAPADVSALEEAAILFANEQDDAAAALLESQLQQDPQSDIELWLMLFELYQLHQNKAAFEELALRFVVRFERTGPTWRSNHKKVKAAPDVEGQLALPPQLDLAHTTIAIRQLEQYLQKFSKVEVGCAAVATLEADGANLLCKALRDFRLQHKHLTFKQAENLDQLLASHIETGRANADDAPFWLLRLEFLQWLNDETCFDNAAVDYAVTFEVSPPSWEPPKPAAAKTPAALPAVTPASVVTDEDFFPLEGAYTGARTDELDQLLAYAEDKSKITIACLKLDRMDFVAGGHLLNLLIQLQQRGKEVHLRHVSHLVGGLFRVLDIQAFCKVHYRK
ncbi:type IV pilus assembly protein FimV [Leeia oryzae]|uniref:type IV pilus assembly protein FimV n=1 Tax=Leeia oryzae TaxID=356662 RepID=UPI0003621507|nr:hypothetical protein [Leeia oryzae]